MDLQEWEIWHTYSSFFVKPIKDLNVLAQKLVEDGIAECSSLINGECFWMENDSAVSGKLSIFVHPDNAKSTFELQPIPANPFITECLKQAAYFRFAEIRLYKADGLLPPPYVRAYLGECRLASEDISIAVYPIITIYQSGIILIELRLISPDRSISSEELLDKYINTFKWPFNKMALPPRVAFALMQSDIFYRKNNWSIRHRLMLALVFWRYRKRIKEESYTDSSGDFSHQFYDLQKPEAPKDPMFDIGHTTSDLSQLLMMGIGWSLNVRRLGLGFLLFGQPPLPELGSYWVTRPHCYIIRHTDQKETASENEKVHGDDFGWIMSRTTGTGIGGRQYLPKNLRTTEDYGAYVAPQGSLWAWSKSGVTKQSKPEDKNREGFIYEPQVMMELVDYVFMFHKRFAEMASVIESTDEVLAARKELASLQMNMSSVSRFGEINELIEAAWKRMNVEKLRSQIADALAIRKEEKELLEERTENRRSILLTFFFGMLAAPTLASEFTTPLIRYLTPLWLPAWQSFRFPIPQDPNLIRVISVVLTFSYLMGLLWVCMRHIRVALRR
jgi:hypothetical protein